jgi:3-methylcrotonyl-CoA carboxylase alpha subunit
MHRFHFSDEPAVAHTVWIEPGSARVQVDGAAVAVRDEGEGRFKATLGGHAERVHAVAHGDTVFVHARGRCWRIEREDPTRRSGSAGGAAAGASFAPMPGVVVAWQAALGQAVREGDALLVIESMKLQTTITAACSGVLAELPFALGSSFARAALLARVVPAGGER